MRISLCLVIFIVIPTNKAMETFATESIESFAVISQGCKPLELISAFWQENKQMLYYSAMFLLGGCFLYDWVCKGKQIKQLEESVQALQTDRTTTTILSEIRRVENRVDLQEKNANVFDKDITYLWRYIYTDNAIHEHNKINNEGKPYEKRPWIPWFNGKSIIDVIKRFGSSEPQEFKGEHFHFAMPLPSPRRRKESPPRSSSPTTVSPRDDIGNGKNGNGKKSGRRSPEVKEKEKEK